jgi:hypothetical protein
VSAIEILEQIRHLPEKERREVARQILEEFGDFDDGLSPEQIEEAERRAERLSRNPESGIPWEQIRAELPERLKSRKCAAK